MRGLRGQGGLALPPACRHRRCRHMCHLPSFQCLCWPQGKAAMSLKVIKPTWEHVGSGLKIRKEGTVLLEFANAVSQQQYDWANKQVGGA